jgi:hypothetical protein
VNHQEIVENPIVPVVSELARPSELADKAFFTPEEASEYFNKRLGQYLGQSKTDIHYDDAIWQDENIAKEANLQTSLILDPPNGKVPRLTPAAGQRARARAEARAG